MIIPSELGHIAEPINFLSRGKTIWPKRVSNPRPLSPGSYALPLRHTGSATRKNAGIPDPDTEYRIRMTAVLLGVMRFQSQTVR